MTARSGWKTAGALALGLVAAGCGGDGGGTEPPEPVDPTIVATVTVSPATHTFTAVGETLQFEAEARNAAGQALTPALTWSSSAAGVVEVDETGLATAVSNGAATIRATAQDVDGEAEGVVSQALASFARVGEGLPAGAVGQPLDSLIELRAADANGHGIPGVAVTFAATAGGSVDPATGTTDADGLVTTSWTLGAAAGPQTLEVAVPSDVTMDLVITGNAFAADPAVLSLHDGDGQSELAGLALPAPVRVLVVDAHGNPAADVAVTFSASDGGAIAPAEALTDLDGVATGVWTLGPGLGAQTAAAQVVVEDEEGGSVELEGSPLAFAAEAVALEVTGLSPETATAGSTMTVTGTGFAPTPAANLVEVGGIAAEVLEGTQTSLVIRIPASACEAIGTRAVAVSRAEASSGLDAVIHPVEPLALEVGGYAVLDDPAAFCLQFPGSETAGHEYLVGLTGTRELAAFAGFTLIGDDGVTPIPVPLASTSLVADAGMSASATSPTASPERVLRDWERSFRATRPALARTAGAAGPATGDGRLLSANVAAVPGLGQLMTFRVPDITVDPCNAYTAASTRVVTVGEDLVIAVDADLSSAVESSLSPVFTAFNELFSESILDRALAYFGAATDLDENGRTVVVFTRAFNAVGVPAFSSAVDLVDRAVCPASDAGEVIYVAIPDLTLAGITEAVEWTGGPATAHELTHVIQSSRRMGAGMAPLPQWAREGAAALAEEVIGMRLRGEAPGMDLDGESTDTFVGNFWYGPRFDGLSAFFGRDPSADQFEGAPERCSLFGFTGLNVPCVDAYAEGAAWSFLRYVSDRIRAVHPGGESAFHRALLMSDGAELIALLEASTGSTFPTLMAEWAMTLYVDNRLPAGAAGLLEITSWDLEALLGSGHAWSLNPDEFGFASFARPGTIVGGGTGYTRIVAPAAHGPLTVRARDTEDRPLGTELAPRLWVVRIQ